jgi:hypothetical protein
MPEQGARIQRITVSVIRTARQQNLDPIAVMAGARLSREPTASNVLTPPARLPDLPGGLSAMIEPTELRYRIVCYELEADKQTVILDEVACGFIAVTGTIDENGTIVRSALSRTAASPSEPGNRWP